MDATIATAASRISPAPLLRQALIADAVASGATGLLTLLGGTVLAPLLGLPAGLLQGVGLVCLGWAVLLAWLARREMLAGWVVWLVIALNLLWAADSFLLLASGWVAPTALGVAFVAAQAVAVAGLAGAQWLGLRQSRS